MGSMRVMIFQGSIGVNTPMSLMRSKSALKNISTLVAPSCKKLNAARMSLQLIHDGDP